MAMEPGPDRPEENEGSDAENPESWYFDLPSGAWERQEAKNRELRQRVLNNLDDEPARNDPFARRPQPEARKGGLFGLGKKKGGPEEPHETAGGTFRLARAGEAPGFGDLPRPSDFTDSDEDEWTTEPSIPEKLHPAIFPGPDGDGSERSFDQFEDDYVEDEPAAFEPAPRPAYVEGPKSVSRWADTFGGSGDAGDDDAELDEAEDSEDTISAMRAWVTRPAEIDDGSSDADQPETDDEPAPQMARATAFEPGDSRDDAIASDPVGIDDPEDPIAAMRAWVQKSAPAERPFVLRPEQPAPEAPAEVVAETPEPEPTSVQPPTLGFVRRSADERDEDEPEDKGEKWNEMFEGAAEQPGGLSLMAEWAKHKPWDGEGEMPEDLLKPFDWETEDAEDSTESAEAKAEPATNGWADVDEPADDVAEVMQREEDPQLDAAPGSWSAPAARADWEQQEADQESAADDVLDEPVAAIAETTIAHDATDDWDDDFANDPLIARALSGEPADVPVEPKKPRGLARLFRRGKKVEPEPDVEAVTGTGDWLPVDEAEEPAAATVPSTQDSWTDEAEEEVPVSEWKWPEPAANAEDAESGTVAEPDQDEELAGPAGWAWHREEPAGAEAASSEIPEPGVNAEEPGAWGWAPADDEPAVNAEAIEVPSASTEEQPVSSWDGPAAWDWQSRERLRRQPANGQPGASSRRTAGGGRGERCLDVELAGGAARRQLCCRRSGGRRAAGSEWRGTMPSRGVPRRPTTQRLPPSRARGRGMAGVNGAERCLRLELARRTH